MGIKDMSKDMSMDEWWQAQEEWWGKRVIDEVRFGIVHATYQCEDGHESMEPGLCPHFVLTEDAETWQPGEPAPIGVCLKPLSPTKGLPSENPNAGE
jgi:hypothetical protein